MKLLEVAPDFMKSQAGTLMTILQYLESKTKTGVQVPIANIAKLMNNAGYSFSYGALDELINSNPNLRDMISDYNQEHIVLGKESVADKEPDESDIEKQTATVDNMASKASKF
jgi:hypothetical protein